MNKDIILCELTCSVSPDAVQGSLMRHPVKNTGKNFVGIADYDDSRYPFADRYSRLRERVPVTHLMNVQESRYVSVDMLRLSLWFLEENMEAAKAKLRAAMEAALVERAATTAKMLEAWKNRNSTAKSE